MAAPAVLPVVDEGLGNSAYLVDLGDGRGLVVDAARDLRAIRAAADRANLRIAYAADTHLHADFLSGAVQLAATDGVTVLASAAGGRRFPHTGLADGDEVDLGGLRLRTLATPGHTPEHLSFLLLDRGGAGEAPQGVFTGGSLLVGSAARTDLAGADRTQELARAQYASLTRLLTLPDATTVWPTHGAGSFCSAPPGTDRVTTIGRERTTNPLLTGAGIDAGGVVDEDTFVARLLAGLGSYPAYFARLGGVNRLGPAPVTEPVALPALDVAGFTAELAAGAQVIDVRPATAFAAAHLPGALSITLRPVFATCASGHLPGAVHLELGRLTAPDAAQRVPAGPLVVMCGHGERAMTAASLLARAGRTGLAVLNGGPDDWSATTGTPLSAGTGR